MYSLSADMKKQNDNSGCDLDRMDDRYNLRLDDIIGYGITDTQFLINAVFILPVQIEIGFGLQCLCHSNTTGDDLIHDREMHLPDRPGLCRYNASETDEPSCGSPARQEFCLSLLFSGLHKIGDAPCSVLPLVWQRFKEIRRKQHGAHVNHRACHKNVELLRNLNFQPAARHMHHDI